jgi:DNA-binding response OmpR family regulator
MNHVLIIDDEADFGYFIKENLQFDNRYCVNLATDGMMGLKIARETNPDVIVLDIMMPQMDGLQVLKGLRAQKATQNTPVIMLTAKKDDDSIVEAIGLSSEMYIVKPIEMDVLGHKIESLLKSQLLKESCQSE